MDARDQVNVFLMAGTLGVGGFVSADGSIDIDRLRSAVGDRLADPAFKDLARFTQKVRLQQPLRWQTCETDLVWHVRLVTSVQGREGLADLCATLMTVSLPLDRPMWELLIVPGASVGGPGVILRVHHAVADGVTGVRLVQRLFDGAPAIERVPSRSVPAPPIRSRWRSFVTGVSRVVAMFRATVPRTVLLGPIGGVRGVAFAEVELGPLARAAKAVGATVNDALLAATTVAVDAALRVEGRPVPPVLPTSVPVALANRGASGNAGGVMVVGLLTGELDTGARLAQVAAGTRAAKSEARAQGTYELTRTRWGSLAFAWLARRQRFIALFVTNVHGPDLPVLIAGAPLEHAWPVAPIQGNVRFGVAAMSYAGRFGVAVHVDAGALQAGVAARALGDELAKIASRP
jgi:hypothetical protein